MNERELIKAITKIIDENSHTLPVDEQYLLYTEFDDAFITVPYKGKQLEVSVKSMLERLDELRERDLEKLLTVLQDLYVSYSGHLFE